MSLMCTSLSSSLPSYSGFLIPSTCASISRDLRFCTNIFSILMLRFFSLLDTTMSITIAVARLIIRALVKRDR